MSGSSCRTDRARKGAHERTIKLERGCHGFRREGEVVIPE